MTIDYAGLKTVLYSAVLSDTLDSFNRMDQAMRPFVRPLDESLVMFGRARTGLYMPVYHVEPGINPYEHEIALVDDLKLDDVAVLACPPGNRIGPWGELLSTAARATTFLLAGAPWRALHPARLRDFGP